MGCNLNGNLLSALVAHDSELSRRELMATAILRMCAHKLTKCTQNESISIPHFATHTIYEIAFYRKYNTNQKLKIIV